MLLVIGADDDPHVLRVCEALRELRVEHVILWSGDFPISDQACLSFEERTFRGSYTVKGRRIDLDDVSAVWYRRLASPRLDEQISDAEARRFALGESRAFLRGLWNILQDRFWMNALTANEVAGSKPLQLAVAQNVGLTIPRTLITNKPSDVAAFVQRSEGPVIYKPLESFATDPSPDGAIPAKCVYTNIITSSHLNSFGAQVRLSPCLFQEYVPKQVELRITIIGDEFLTAAIDSQASEKSRVDWRRYDLERTPYQPYQLSEVNKQKLSALMKELGLVYGAIDCVVRPDGEMVFLEVNPGGQWLWIEELTQLPIGLTIARFLASHVAEPAFRRTFTPA